MHTQWSKIVTCTIGKSFSLFYQVGGLFQFSRAILRLRNIVKGLVRKPILVSTMHEAKTWYIDQRIQRTLAALKKTIIVIRMKVGKPKDIRTKQKTINSIKSV